MQKGIIKNVNKLTGDPIDAKDLASMLSGIIGNESGVLTVFDELRLEKMSDNKVRLHSGVYSLKGHILYIPKGSYEDFTIDSGTLGANRIDLLVAEYVRNGEGDGEDALQFKVIKGESTSGSPQSPDLIQQDINENGITHQEALYTLRLTGTSLNITKNYQRHFSLQGQTKQLEQAIKNQEDRIESGFNELDKRIETGGLTLAPTDDIGGGNYRVVHRVNFKKPFKFSPRVMVSPHTQSTHLVLASVRSVDNEGFDLVYIRPNKNSGFISWVAVSAEY